MGQLLPGGCSQVSGLKLVPPGDELLLVTCSMVAHPVNQLLSGGCCQVVQPVGQPVPGGCCQPVSQLLPEDIFRYLTSGLNSSEMLAQVVPSVNFCLETVVR